MRLTALVGLMVYLSSISYAQSTRNTVLQFSAKVIDHRVLLTWKTAAGFSCQDIQIQVAIDSAVQFRHDTTYFGICGDLSEKTYTMVVNGLEVNENLFIRLDLGAFGYSDTIALRIPSFPSDFTVYPNPASNFIIVRSALNEPFQVAMYSVDQRELFVTEMKEDAHVIDTRGCPPGIHMLHITTSDGQIVYRRLVVD